MLLAEWSSVFGAVEERAEELGVSGFLVAGDRYTRTVKFALICCEEPLRQGVEGKDDANFAAIAFAKLGTVLSRGQDTPADPPFKGESPWKGGVKGDGPRFRFCAAFSGADEEVDAELAEVALHVLMRL